MAGTHPSHNPTAALAQVPGFGSVYDCGACGHVHLAIGPVAITLAREAYLQLVAMLNTSAANFEAFLHNDEDGTVSWKESAGQPYPDEQSDFHQN
jgi:hypothetical protein